MVWQTRLIYMTCLLNLKHVFFQINHKVRLIMMIFNHALCKIDYRDLFIIAEIIKGSITLAHYANVLT